jgi:toxin secretion/phage lysis holin
MLLYSLEKIAMSISDLRVSFDKFTIAIGLILGVLVTAMGGWSGAFQALIWFILIDFVLGTTRAAIQGTLSSATSLRKTALKTLLLWALTTFAYQIDTRLGTNSVTRDAVLVFFTVAQGTSVLENAVPIAEAAGWEVPPFLQKVLEQLGNNKKPPTTPC